MAYPRILIRDFTKGLNNSDLPAELADDEYYSIQSPVGNGPRIIERPDVADAQFAKLRNLFVNRLGRLRVRGGNAAVMASLAAPVTGFTRYINRTLARLVYASGPSVWIYNESTNAAATAIATVIAGAKVDFVTLYDTIYWTDGTSFFKWAGTGSAQALGIAAPTTPCASAVGTAGSLLAAGIASTWYGWYYTYVEADGTESNPSPISTPLLQLTNQRANLSGITVSVNAAVTSRNIYRVGGNLNTVRLVGAIADNLTTTYVDNAADLSVGPNLLNFAHDVPVAGPTFFVAHKNRLAAAGDPANPYRLSFSSFGNANYWPTTIYDPLNDGGYMDMPEPEFGNPIVGLANLGSILIVACAKSFYAVYGDSFNDFSVRRLCGIGCVARRTLQLCKDSLLFLAGDGMIYSFSDAEPVPIALPLRDMLQAVLPSDLANASAVYQDQRYTVFIPQAGKGPVNVCYDFEAKSWTDVSDPLLTAGAAYGVPNTSLLGETLIATAPGYLDATGAAYNGILSIFLHTAGNNSLVIDFATPQFEFGRPSFTKRAKRLKIEGIYTAGTSSQLTAQVTASTPGRTPFTKIYLLSPSATEGKLLDVELSPRLVGRRLMIEIVGSVTQFEMNTMEIAFQFLREAA